MKAFPTTIDNEGYQIDHQGMDLRDYFAAKAMQGLINDEKLKDTIVALNQHISKTIPKLAYEYADAMMKARESK
jgi:hypothetical protein